MNTEDLRHAVVDPETGGLVIRTQARPTRTPTPYHDRYWDVRHAVVDPKTGGLVIGRVAPLAKK